MDIAACERSRVTSKHTATTTNARRLLSDADVHVGQLEHIQRSLDAIRSAHTCVTRKETGVRERHSDWSVTTRTLDDLLALLQPAQLVQLSGLNKTRDILHGHRQS